MLRRLYDVIGLAVPPATRFSFLEITAAAKPAATAALITTVLTATTAKGATAATSITCISLILASFVA